MPRTTRLLIAVITLTALLDPGPAGAFTPAEAKAPMTVTLVRSDAASCGANCPEWLALTGAIGPGTPALFSAALARLGQRRVPVLVDSPGGSVEAALAMGKAIRARKLDVAVAGTALTDCAASDRACAARRRTGERPGFVAGGIAACASACVLLLASGTERSVGENSYVGVHQMVVHQTYTRVMNYFRVLRRMVGGRAVEISRTLVATRPISSRTVLAAAPEQLYSDVDRYLLAMGVAESIMPLMRSAPPSGVHWMTRLELAATRIANDAVEAGTLVARATEKPPTGAAASATVPADMTLADDSRSTGTVDWHLDPSSPAGPALVGTFVVPENDLRGSVTIRRVSAIGTGDGFIAAVALQSGIKGHPWSAQAPRLCDASVCNTPFTATPSRDDGAGARDFGVIRSWGDAFLSYLKDRDSLVIDSAAPDLRYGSLALSLTGGARGIVEAWEHLCCGLALPSPPEGAGLAPTPLEPATGPARKPAATSLDALVSYRLDDTRRPTPVDGEAMLSWTPLPPATRPGEPPGTALIGTLEIPEAGLHLSLEVGPVGPAGSEDVVLDLSLTESLSRFGPTSRLAVPLIKGADGHVALFADRIEPLDHGGGYHVVLAPTGDLPGVASLGLHMTDASGRSLTMTVPIEGPLRAVLRRVREAQGAAGG